MEGHWRPTLLGRLGGVNLKIQTKYLNEIHKKYTYSQLEERPKNFMAITEPLSFVSETVSTPYRKSFVLLYWSTITPELKCQTNEQHATTISQQMSVKSQWVTYLYFDSRLTGNCRGSGDGPSNASKFDGRDGFRKHTGTRNHSNTQVHPSINQLHKLTWSESSIPACSSDGQVLQDGCLLSLTSYGCAVDNSWCVRR